MYSAIEATPDHSFNVHDAIDDVVSHLDAESDGNFNAVFDDSM